jgi:hypothetical protein
LEPTLNTDPRLIEILEELKALEPIFHKQEAYSTFDVMEKMMAPTFWEIGASGHRYSREYVCKVLSERLNNPKTENCISNKFHCQAIAENIYLLTYLLQQGDRITQRSSIWQRTPKGWQILFHQGTIVSQPR